MSYFDGNFDEPFYVVRRDVIGKEDGTPLYGDNRDEDRPPDYCRFEEPLATSQRPNTSGTATGTGIRARIFCSPEVDVRDNDQVDVKGERWRVDSIVRPEGISTMGLCEIEISREKRS